MKRALLLGVAAVLAAPSAASAEPFTIAIPGRYFDPPRATVVAGDVVTFRNTHFETHDVRLRSGLFDSGPIARGLSWSQQLTEPGGYPYLCTLHPFMSANLDVVAAALVAAPDGVLAGEPLTLSGRAPAGTPHVGVERSLGGGEWLPDGAGAAPAHDGSFSATVSAAEGARYRVTTPAGPSREVTPNVTARVDVHITVRRKRVEVHAMPAPKGFVATLELYARWRYRWRAHATAKLDAHGMATFRMPKHRRTYARIALQRHKGGPALVRSGVVKLWNGRAAQDPDGIAPPGPGHGGGHGGH